MAGDAPHDFGKAVAETSGWAARRLLASNNSAIDKKINEKAHPSQHHHGPQVMIQGGFTGQKRIVTAMRQISCCQLYQATKKCRPGHFLCPHELKLQPEPHRRA